MTTPVIIDLIAAGLLLVFTLAGARRGLFRTLAGLLIIVLAMAGGRFAAEKAAPAAAEFLAPAVERRIQKELDEALPEAEDLVPGQMPGDYAAGIEDLLGALGVRGSRMEDLADQARENIRDTGASALTAVAVSAAESVLYSLIYILAFIALTAALRLAAKAMDLMMKLPVLHSANALLGALAGALEGLLIVLVLFLLLRTLGVPLEDSRLGFIIDLTRLL